MIRAFEEQDEAAVIAVWHRSGLAAYRFLPTWQALTLEKAREVFRETARRAGCDIWVGTHDAEIVAFLAINGSCIFRILSPQALELHTHQENHPARRLYEKHGFAAVKFGVSPPPESAPDVEYHWRP